MKAMTSAIKNRRRGLLNVDDNQSMNEDASPVEGSDLEEQGESKDEENREERELGNAPSVKDEGKVQGEEDNSDPVDEERARIEQMYDPRDLSDTGFKGKAARKMQEQLAQMPKSHMGMGKKKGH